jgi:DNA-directed RNA polymerase specialized sigma24 family protein
VVDQRALLMAALAELPARQRAVVVLRYWEDMTETQVAAVLRCSVGTVKSQASKGLARLRASAALRDPSDVHGESRGDVRRIRVPAEIRMAAGEGTRP